MSENQGHNADCGLPRYPWSGGIYEIFGRSVCDKANCESPIGEHRVYYKQDEIRAAIRSFGVEPPPGNFGPLMVHFHPPRPLTADEKADLYEWLLACPECGDHRGWRVEPHRNTGEAVQVQCRACAEHECPTAPDGGDA